MRLQEKGPRDTAIEKGVAHLLAKQNRDGSFGQIHKTALTGLAVMSLMAAKGIVVLTTVFLLRGCA